MMPRHSYPMYLWRWKIARNLDVTPADRWPQTIGTRVYDDLLLLTNENTLGRTLQDLSLKHSQRASKKTYSNAF